MAKDIQLARRIRGETLGWNYFEDPFERFTVFLLYCIKVLWYNDSGITNAIRWLLYNDISDMTNY